MKMLLDLWKPKSLKSYWNKKAKYYPNFSASPSTLFYREPEIEFLSKLFPSLKAKKFLSLDLWDEVHNTQILSWVLQKGGQIFGIDISDYQVKKTRKKFKKFGIPEFNFKTSDIRKVNFPDNFFDIVFGLGTIEHVPDYGVAIKEVFRVLRPGGVAIVGVPNKLDPFLRPAMVWLLERFDR